MRIVFAVLMTIFVFVMCVGLGALTGCFAGLFLPMGRRDEYGLSAAAGIGLYVGGGLGALLGLHASWRAFWKQQE